jgi:MFS superfamily sulfate permease-like transporter
MVSLNALPVNVIMGAFCAVAMMQIICCPTNTHNVWVTSYTGEEVTATTKKLLPWVWPVVLIGVIAAVVMYF